MPLDWIESNSIALDSNESSWTELEWAELSAVHWMLLKHGLDEFPTVGFLEFEIPTSPQEFG